MKSRLSSYEDNGDSTDTVADIIAAEMNILLGSDEGLGILAGNADVTYYETNEDGGLTSHNVYNDELSITSLMWTVPLGT